MPLSAAALAWPWAPGVAAALAAWVYAQRVLPTIFWYIGFSDHTLLLVSYVGLALSLLVFIVLNRLKHSLTQWTGWTAFCKPRENTV